MQRKEVTQMHVATNRTHLVFIVLAVTAPILAALGLASMDPELMPVLACPPHC
jgi:hypothetical protein